jgi:hypothetical protein
VDLRPQLERNQWKTRNLRDLGKEDIDRIAAAYGLVRQTRKNSSPVNGKTARKPPLTSEARRALSEIALHAGDISGSWRA